MKLLTGLGIAAALLIGTDARAQAQEYNYSYKWQSGDVITGTFIGTANGNLITGLSNVTAIFDGVAFNGSGSLSTGQLYFPSGWGSPGGVVSFDGLQNNFIFVDAGATFNLNNATNEFLSDGSLVPAKVYFPGSNSGTSPYAAFNASNWSVTAAVPEPSSYALAVVGLFAVFGMKRRADKQA